MSAREGEKEKFCQRERKRKINIASKRKRGGERQSLPVRKGEIKVTARERNR